MDSKRPLRIDLASPRPEALVPRSQTTKSFKQLMGYCDEMKDDIGVTWELAKIESISRCNTLDDLYKKSRVVTHGNDWKLLPEYDHMRVKLAQRKQTGENSTWAGQVDLVKNLLDMKRTKQVLVKSISNLHMKRLISRCKRKFGEGLKEADIKSDLYRARPTEIKKQVTIEELLTSDEQKPVYLTEVDAHVLSTRQLKLERSLTARKLTPEWDYDKLDDKNRVVFERRDKFMYNNRKVFLMQREKALDLKMRSVQPSEEIRRKAEWIVNHSPSLTRLGSRRSPKIKQKFSVSNTNSPRIVRHQPSDEDVYLKIEVEKELSNLKSRLNIARYVTDKRHKDKMEGRESHKFISPSAMKLITKSHAR
jgi:hypothetical protein